MNAIANFLGYQITEQLYVGTRTLVYRGIRTKDQYPVAIKILRNEYPNFNELVQFRNQYTIAKNLNFSSIIQPLALEVYRNSYALIMEDFGGVSLSNYLQTAANQALTLAEFLQIGIQLADILHYLHQNRIIHKDIKPANILINPDTKQIKLIDFSISSLLPRETQEIQNPNILEGTLAYLSPEQTGRMNRGIDYRSDFYSLGVTFYELLTGTLPFVSEDAMELVHCHLAKQPIFINQINPEIPLVLSEIVSKLMEKNAENRYQSSLGIKHDLKICLDQFQKKGQIEYFKIGRRDISDRFLIPEKLYGREQEVAQLLTAFEKVSTGKAAMMLVAGFSGIGKTAVVNEVHKPIVRQRGYFIKGKYDQFQRNIPFSAVVQAFRDLMGQLLSESEAKLQTWKTQILAALGDSGQVLIDVIPELENIIGKQPTAIELSGNAAQNRFNLLLQKFVQVFTSQAHPLVMFLDDLQWADSASLNLLKLLMQDTGHLLILGAYRDNEVSPVHPFILTVDEIIKIGATVNTITLPPLSEPDMNQLVADTLTCGLSLAEPLTKLVYQKTQGNPFFATQFLKALHDDQLISFDSDTHHWQCDLAQVNALAITDDVVEFMALQLQKLPLETQEILKLAACIGAQFDLNTLAIVSEQSSADTAANLWRGLQEGFVIPKTEIYKFFTEANSDGIFKTSANPVYRFLHDRVQQASYSLIPDPQKQAIHLKIGQLLLHRYSEVEQEEKVFDIVRHLNQGQELIAQLKEREDLAKLNLTAGQKARNSTAYTVAKVYLQIGINLLTTNCWQNQYELTLNIYITAAEVAYLNADFNGMEKIATLVLQEAKTILDKVKIYEIRITALTAQRQLLEAISTARDALLQLGVELPTTPEEAKIGEAIQAMIGQQNGRPIDELIDLPVMNDASSQAAMELLGVLFPTILQGMPGLIPILSSKMVSLSLQFGNAPASAVGYVIHGMVLCSFFGEVETGYSFGKLALNLLDRFNIRKFKSTILVLFGGFIQHCQEALRATMKILKDGYLAGIETGDFLNAGYSICAYFDANFFAGVELDTLEIEITAYRDVMADLKQYSAQNYLDMKQQVAENLRADNILSDCLIGTAYDETVMIPRYCQSNEFMAIAQLYIYKLLLSYLSGNYPAALNCIAQAKPCLMAISGLFFVPIFHFYAALVYLALIPTESEQEQAKILVQIQTHQNTLQQWAQNAPMNHLHKWYLVEAERQRVLGNKVAAIEYYDRAIKEAKENEYIQEEALSNELAAKFYLAWDKEKFAAGYMQDAYYCYVRWGAKAKVVHLEQHYPQLLAPILKPAGIGMPSGASINLTLTKSVTRTSSGENFWLDFPAVMKAAQAISQEIELDKLLATLMQIALSNGGAKIGRLVLRQDEQWFVVAQAAEEQTEILEIPLEQYPEIPHGLIYVVARTQETAVFDNLSMTKQFAGDRYIIAHQPKSILCIPINNRGKLIGILYLENNLTVGAFTRERVEILQMLAAQAAISIKNARLYKQVENYSQILEVEVARKTEDLSQKAFDLEQAFKNLQQTQAQLIQSEKMSSLGQLVAGIAHEINNPVTFISSNLQHTETHVKDLLSLLALYQQEYPQSSAAIQDKISEIDLGFLWKDLTKILQSMKVGSDRISQIILSLRNFSRLDESDMKEVDLHSGIESTLLILHSRLEGSDRQPKIRVIKDYGNLPDVTCYASQLNQVFLSIISNAIDALQESAMVKKPLLLIRTETIENDFVRIAIADNGIGIPSEIQERIFDPFFTTKPVGSGTGLGLSVSYAIIKKHGGQLICHSTPGEGTELAIEIPIRYSARLTKISQKEPEKSGLAKICSRLP
jgi:predicted ATPase/signal transduction histidine kinase